MPTAGAFDELPDDTMIGLEIGIELGIYRRLAETAKLQDRPVETVMRRALEHAFDCGRRSCPHAEDELPGVRLIPLSSGRVTMVDEEDYEVLAAHRWWWMPSKQSGYAYRQVTVGWSPEGKQLRRSIPMHREIMGMPDGLVDHRDNDGLNNRRSNLRVATKTQNAVNSKGPGGGASRYKGVSRHRDGWRATIQSQRRQRFLGHFATEEEAARAYDEAAFEMWEDFAHLNFRPDE